MTPCAACYLAPPTCIKLKKYRRDICDLCMHASAVKQKVITLINKNPCRVILLRFNIVEISGMKYIFLSHHFFAFFFIF